LGSPLEDPKDSDIQGYIKVLSIFSYLDPDLVCFLEEKDREEVLQKLVDLLNRGKKLKDAQAFYQAIVEREKIVSTGIGMGVAVPHAKLPGYDTFFIAIGIHRQGIEWDAIDGLPVRLFFMIGGPDDRQTEYLQMLSRLTLAIKDEKLRKKMLQLSSKEEIIQLFREV
jgi:PTS system nitrogen regulatory IIA component